MNNDSLFNVICNAYEYMPNNIAYKIEYENKIVILLEDLAKIIPLTTPTCILLIFDKHNMNNVLSYAIEHDIHTTCTNVISHIKHDNFPYNLCNMRKINDDEIFLLMRMLDKVICNTDLGQYYTIPITNKPFNIYMPKYQFDEMTINELSKHLIPKM